MRGRERRAETRPATATQVFLVSALLGANLAVVGPRTLYTANATEFAASYWSVLWLFVAAAAAIAIALSVLQLLVPRRVRSRAVVFVFSLGVLAWLQGNWLVGNFGLLDGAALDFSAEAHTRIRDAALWLAVTVAAQAFHRLLSARVGKFAGIFLAIQLAALPFDLDARDGSSESATAPPALIADDAIFEFSSDTNIVLLILDSATADTFTKFVNRNLATYAAAFSGFTFFPDNAGVFPWTQFSVSAMLGAPLYDNRTPVDDYMAESLQRDSITVSLLAAGYTVDWVAASPLYCLEGRYSNCFSIPRPYESPHLHRAQMAAQLFDLSVFRHAPYGLKRMIYRDGDWLAQAALWREADAPVFVSSAAAFFADFAARAYVGRSAPTFKILHAGGGHLPSVLDADCNVVPKRDYTQRSYEDLMRCSMKQTRALLGRLREIGVYDRALIVVAGDHGSRLGAWARGSHGLDPVRLSRSRPLLAVKWPSGDAGLHRSTAPASVSDIAATIAAVAGIETRGPGRDLAKLERGEDRRRRYGIYLQRKGTPGGHLERLERYAVGPESRRPGAWAFESVVFSPEVELPAREITAGVPGADAHFSYLGWGKPARTFDGTAYVPAFGPIAAVFVELPRSNGVGLAVRLRVPESFLPQTIEVVVDGVAASTLRIERTNFADHTIEIPGRLVRPRVSAIEFRSTNSQPAEAGRRVSAFDLERIRVLEPGHAESTAR